MRDKETELDHIDQQIEMNDVHVIQIYDVQANYI